MFGFQFTITDPHRFSRAQWRALARCDKGARLSLGDSRGIWTIEAAPGGALVFTAETLRQAAQQTTLDSSLLVSSALAEAIEKVAAQNFRFASDR